MRILKLTLNKDAFPLVEGLAVIPPDESDLTPSATGNEKCAQKVINSLLPLACCLPAATMAHRSSVSSREKDEDWRAELDGEESERERRWGGGDVGGRERWNKMHRLEEVN